jgi:hypothetical protein
MCVNIYFRDIVLANIKFNLQTLDSIDKHPNTNIRSYQLHIRVIFDILTRNIIVYIFSLTFGFIDNVYLQRVGNSDFLASEQKTAFSDSACIPPNSPQL